MKKTITKDEYLMLEGIRALSNQLNKQLEQMVLTTAEITGEELDEDDYGHASDFIFGFDDTAKTHLKKLGLKIK